MLAPDISPIHQLVAPWWKAKSTVCFHGIHALRTHLWETAVAEMHANAAAGRVYDPAADSRFLWASAMLNRAEGHPIDPDLAARAAYVFDPPIRSCGRDLAACNHN